MISHEKPLFTKPSLESLPIVDRTKTKRDKIYLLNKYDVKQKIILLQTIVGLFTKCHVTWFNINFESKSIPHM